MTKYFENVIPFHMRKKSFPTKAARGKKAAKTDRMYLYFQMNILYHFQYNAAMQAYSPQRLHQSVFWMCCKQPLK